MQPNQWSPGDPVAQQWDAQPPYSPYYPPTPALQAPGMPLPGAPGTPAMPMPGMPVPTMFAPYGAVWAAPRRRERRPLRKLGGVILAGGLLGFIGSIAPWVSGNWDESYLEGYVMDGGSGLNGGGVLTVLFSFTAMIMGAILLARTLLGLPITAMVMGALTLIIALLNVADIRQNAHAIKIVFRLEVSVGWGLWLVVVAGFIMTFAGLLGIFRAGWIDPPAAPSAAFANPYVQ